MKEVYRAGAQNLLATTVPAVALEVQLYRHGEVIDIAHLGGVADATTETRFVSDVPGVDRIRIGFGGSGAIDDIGYESVVSLVE